MKSLLLILFSLLFGAHNYVNAQKNEEMWVEAKERTDTLTFFFDEGKTGFILNRGKELRNGNLYPKSLHGPYDYILKGDSIYLRWMMSSNSKPKAFYYHLGTDTLLIGGFL